jgi:acetyl-CoA acetyltransferase
MNSLTRPVAIAGVGYSELSRKGEPNPNSLAIAAAKAALSDAGLTAADVDGIFEYKFGPESPGAQDMARLLGIPDLAAFTDIMASNPSGLAGALAGVMAVASGACETVLVFRCLTRSAGHQGGVASGPETVGGRDHFLTPYGYLGGILVNLALKKQRWMAEYGRPEDDFGRIAVNARRWSALNPRAVLRDELAMDDYLSSRMVVDPLRVLDCDYPVNGAVATVITTAEGAADLRQPVVLVDAMTYATGRGADWVFDVDFLYGGAFECANRLWQRSSLTLADVDVAQLYDGFTPVTVAWI